jgi:hypothetical protein
MKKNFDKAIREMDGTEVLIGDKPLLMKEQIINAIMRPQEETLTGIQIIERYDLCMKITKGGEQDYTAEEEIIIKNALPHKNCSQIIVAQILKYIADKPAVETKAEK